MTQPEPEDALVCICGHVSETTVLRARDRGIRSVNDLREETGANSGCGDCRWDLEDLLGIGP